MTWVHRLGQRYFRLHASNIVLHTRALNGMRLVSLAVLSGCASNSDVAPVSKAHAPAAGPTPGSMKVYVSGSATTCAAFGH